MRHSISGRSLAVLKRWREVVAAHPQDGVHRAAVTFQSYCAHPPRNRLIPLEAVTAVVLQVQPAERGPSQLQFSVFGGERDPWGIRWGGVCGSKLRKNLRLRPRLKAQGKRFDVTRQRTIHLAMDLFAATCNAEDGAVVEHLQLPEGWAGFPVDCPGAGDGPELGGLCSRLGLSRKQMMLRCRRYEQGLYFYPLDFVSHLAEQAELFVELGTAPRIQVLACPDPAETLRGFRGACEFSFLESAFDEPLSLPNSQCR